MLLPTRRTVDILEQEAGKELLVYDLRLNKAYYLNETLRTVYNFCDGRTTFDELKRRYKYTDDLIYLALDELQKTDLIESEKITHFAGMNRREVIKKVGLSTMLALPIISALVAPKAINAASGGFAAGSRTLEQTCNTSTDCNRSAPNCINARSSSNRCCVTNTSRGAYTTGQNQTFLQSGVCPSNCSNCQCALDYCGGNAIPCCSGRFSSASFNNRIVSCNC